ncbi:uncharacterized protein LOC130783283 [Actinidia eriantha]|uniref:uncharacterized protein LOC130783283 n=1 Tax=Actinidia eriantha TaxID=165200 RepID=UPI00258DC7C9|nr:uncharacterized protein LOC130783283 [Actinidia eriantha]
MAQLQDNYVENIDDESSYEIIEWNEFCISESDQENSSAESEPQENEIESSDTETDDVVLDLFELQLDETLHYGKVAYQKEYANPFEFRAHIKCKNEMKIKDVVKDNVLPFLPAKSLVQFKAVSKDWDLWISSPFLAHKQSCFCHDVSGFFCQSGISPPTFITLNHSAYGVPSPSLDFLPEPVVIRSSCNGLLLCQGYGVANVYYVCNPVNKEWKSLPQPNYYHQIEPALVLAFEPSELNFSAHFEIVCAFKLLDVPIIYFEIYSSKERSWRCSITSCIELGNSKVKRGFYINGMAYWETSSAKILAFDLKSEFYGILPLPPAPNGVMAYMHGELSYVHAHKSDGNVCTIDVYGGMDMSPKLSVPLKLEDVGILTGECRVLPCVNEHVVAIFAGGVVYSYHLRDQKLEVISMNLDISERYLPYVNSLVSVAT